MKNALPHARAAGKLSWLFGTMRVLLSLFFIPISLTTSEDPEAICPKASVAPRDEFFGFLKESTNDNGPAVSGSDKRRLIRSYVNITENYANTDNETKKRFVDAYEKYLKIKETNYVKEVDAFIKEKAGLQGLVENLEKNSVKLKIFLTNATADGKNDVCAFPHKTTPDRLSERSVEYLKMFVARNRYNLRLFKAMKWHLEWNFYQAYALHLFCLGDKLNLEREEFRMDTFIMNVEVGWATKNYRKEGLDMFYDKLKEEFVAPVLDANKNETNDQLANLILQKFRQTHDRHCIVILTDDHPGRYYVDGKTYSNDVNYRGKMIFVFLASECFENVEKKRKSELGALERNDQQSFQELVQMAQGTGLAHFLASPLTAKYPFSVAKSREEVGVVKNVKIHDGQAFVAIVF